MSTVTLKLSLQEAAKLKISRHSGTDGSEEKTSLPLPAIESIP
jgi:hypothetical protein